MALYQRNNSKIWWTDIYSPNGQRIRKSTKTTNKRQAKEFEDRLKGELWRSQQLRDKPNRKWEEAETRWLAETSHKKDHLQDKGKLKWIRKHLGGMYLHTIDRDAIDRLVSAKQKEGVSAATINRYLALIRAILRKARDEWKWNVDMPVIRLAKESTGRVRFLTPEKARRLLKELPEHLEVMARFTLLTGLRRSNVTGLRWDRVDLEKGIAWVDAEETKAGHAIGIPLIADTKKILEQQKGKHPEYVFTYKGKPVKQTSTRAWYKALERAGIKNFRWHDLRHTWASWHAQSGTSMDRLQHLGSWKTAAMVRRYAHLETNHLKEDANRLSGML